MNQIDTDSDSGESEITYVLYFGGVYLCAPVYRLRFRVKEGYQPLHFRRRSPAPKWVASHKDSA